MFGYLRKRIRAFKQKPNAILKYPDGKRYYKEFHNIRKQYIDHDATKVINRLQQFGHKAYLVGGSIRDLLLKKRPKDFDVVTSAHPSDIRSIFKNSRIIGKRFKINHIVFNRNKIIEVSTTRSLPKNRILAKGKESLYLTRDNQYGSFKEDAARRDFTLNSLYFDLRNETIIDYTGGFEDIQQRVVKIIGDENISLPEDPVRILRAVKFASILDFKINPDLLKGIRKYKKFISKASVPRLHEEFNKVFQTGKAFHIFSKIVEVGLFPTLFPRLSARCHELDPAWEAHFGKTFLGKRLQISDKMIAEHEDINNNIYYAILIADSILDHETKDAKVNRRKRSHEKTIFENLMKAGKEFGLTRREIERLTQIFCAQENFLKDSTYDQNQSKINSFKNKDYFLEAFIFYKIYARSRDDHESIQRAFFWEIGLRKKLPDAIRKLVYRTLDDQPLGLKPKKRNQEQNKGHRRRSSSSRTSGSSRPPASKLRDK